MKALARWLARLGAVGLLVPGSASAAEVHVMISAGFYGVYDMKLRAPEEVRETVERVHGIFASRCPVFRSLSPGIQITSSYTLVKD